MKKTHKLKTWEVYFDRVWEGEKLFEVRFNDRDFQTGDNLTLQEYNPQTESYSGREVRAKILYILHGGQFGIDSGYVVMSLGEVNYVS